MSGVALGVNPSNAPVSLQVDAAGNLKVNIAAGSAAGGTSSSFGAAFPATGTAIGASDGANMQGLLVDASGFLKVNVAAGGAGGGAVTVADGADVTQGALADAAVTGDNTGSVSAKLRGLSKILADIWDSTNHWFKVNIQNATLAVTQSGAPWSVSGSGTFSVATAPATSGGYTNKSINAANSDNATSVKGSAGQVYGVHVYNNAAYPVYVKLYNKATAPAPGTDNALLVRRIGVQAGTQRDLTFEAGIPFSTGIGLAIVKGISDTDDTSVLASDCLAEVEYA